MHPSAIALALSTLSAIRLAASAPIFRQIVLSSPHTSSSEDVLTALKEASIIPDVLSSFAPTISLSVNYPHNPVSLGSIIPVSATRHRPTVQLGPFASISAPTSTTASNKTYTVVLSDPDATSRAEPDKAQMCHWIVTSIPLSALNASEGLHEDHAYSLELEATQNTLSTEILSYLAPSPPPKTGKHRYVFVLLEGEGGAELSKPDEREHWGYGKIGRGVKEWAHENHLKVVGANFFYAQNKKQ